MGLDVPAEQSAGRVANLQGPKSRRIPYLLMALLERSNTMPSSDWCPFCDLPSPPARKRRRAVDAGRRESMKTMTTTTRRQGRDNVSGDSKGNADIHHGCTILISRGVRTKRRAGPRSWPFGCCFENNQQKTIGGTKPMTTMNSPSPSRSFGTLTVQFQQEMTEINQSINNCNKTSLSSLEAFLFNLPQNLFFWN